MGRTHAVRLHEWLACLGDKTLRHVWLGTACSVIDIVSEEWWSRFATMRQRHGLCDPIAVDFLDPVCLSETEVMM